MRRFAGASDSLKVNNVLGVKVKFGGKFPELKQNRLCSDTFPTVLRVETDLPREYGTPDFADFDGRNDKLDMP